MWIVWKSENHCHNDLGISLPSDSVHPLTRADWRAWLAANFDRPNGVWLITFKKATGQPRVEYDDAVEEALCFGWVDSKPAKLDDDRSMLWFAPRKPKTGWSKQNKDRVAKMTAANMKHPAGLAKIVAAKKDGSWSMLDDVEKLIVPDDLRQMFDAHPSAATHFETFPRSVKRGILEWILHA
jgi:uncharacterized protein YdeI (YjbR/CyaY-like superfamily)